MEECEDVQIVDSDSELHEVYFDDKNAAEIIKDKEEEIYSDNSIDDNDSTEKTSNIINPYLKIVDNKSLVCCADLCLQNNPPLLVTGSMDEIIRVFDLNNGNIIYEIKGHKETVTSLHFHKTKSLLLSADLSGTIKGWNVNDWEKNCFIIDTDSLQWAQWLDQTSFSVVCGMSNGCLQIWDSESLQFSQFYAPPANSEYHVPYATYGKMGCTKIAYGAADGSIRIAEVKSNKILHTFPSKNFGPVSNVCVSLDESLLFALFENSAVIFIGNLVQFREIGILSHNSHQQYIFHTLLMINSFIVTVGNNSNENAETLGIISVWSFSPQRLLNTIEFPIGIDHSLVCHDSRIACSMENGAIYIIDIPSGSKMFAASDSINSIEFLHYFSPEKILLSYDSDQIIYVYHLN